MMSDKIVLSAFKIIGALFLLALFVFVCVQLDKPVEGSEIVVDCGDGEVYEWYNHLWKWSDSLHIMIIPEELPELSPDMFYHRDSIVTERWSICPEVGGGKLFVDTIIVTGAIVYPQSFDWF